MEEAIGETTDVATEAIGETTDVATEAIEETTDAVTEAIEEMTEITPIKITTTKTGSVKDAEIQIFHSELSVTGVRRQKILALTEDKEEMSAVIIHLQKERATGIVPVAENQILQTGQSALVVVNQRE